MGLAMIDDQSSVTFMDPDAARALQLPRNFLAQDTLATSTVQGESKPVPCQVIEGLYVTPLAGDIKVMLLATTIMNPLPNAIDDVPSPDDVANLPGLGRYAKHFPPKNPRWPTILLIGRDCIAAQQQEQFTDSQNQHQILAKTRLGWTAMGSPRPSRTRWSNGTNKQTDHRQEDQKSRLSTPKANICPMPTRPLAFPLTAFLLLAICISGLV